MRFLTLSIALIFDYTISHLTVNYKYCGRRGDAEQRSRVAEEQRSRGAEGQRGRGAEG
jgi:hypothetical protein